MIPTVIVWAEPIKNGDFELAPGDITTAIEWFRNKTEQEPKLIILNKKNENLAEEAGDTIKIMYQGGVLTWEVWLSVEELPATPPKPIESDFESSYDREGLPVLATKKSISNDPPVTMDFFRPRGRPKTYRKRELPEGLIGQLYDEGMGARAIASTLKKRDIIVSYKTIQRLLAGQRVIT